MRDRLGPAWVPAAPPQAQSPSRAACAAAESSIGSPHRSVVCCEPPRSREHSRRIRRSPAALCVAPPSSPVLGISSARLKVQETSAAPPRTGGLRSTVDFAAAPRGKNLCFVVVYAVAGHRSVRRDYGNDDALSRTIPATPLSADAQPTRADDLTYAKIGGQPSHSFYATI